MTTLLLFAMLAQVKIGSGLGATPKPWPEMDHPPFTCTEPVRRAIYFNTTNKHNWMCDGEKWKLLLRKEDKCHFVVGLTKDEDRWEGSSCIDTRIVPSNATTAVAPSIGTSGTAVVGTWFVGTVMPGEEVELLPDGATRRHPAQAAPFTINAEPTPFIFQNNRKEVFSISAGHDWAKCLPAMRDAIEASRDVLLPSITSSYSWTNAQVVDLGAVRSGYIDVAILPAKTRLIDAYVVITGTAAGPSTVTAQCGGVTVDAKAAVDTVFRGIVDARSTPIVTCHFSSTGANLDAVTGSAGRVTLITRQSGRLEGENVARAVSALDAVDEACGEMR